MPADHMTIELQIVCTVRGRHRYLRCLSRCDGNHGNRRERTGPPRCLSRREHHDYRCTNHEHDHDDLLDVLPELRFTGVVHSCSISISIASSGLRTDLYCIVVLCCLVVLCSCHSIVVKVERKNLSVPLLNECSIMKKAKGIRHSAHDTRALSI